MEQLKTTLYFLTFKPRRIMTLSQYFGKFIKMLIDPKNREKTQEQLYIDLEKWHNKRENVNKCKDYASFRSLKSQWYKANKP